jgi:Zn-dependent M28 family amino/carboxypeptidase
MVTPTPPSTDGIYNGALDNASGCAALLSIARAATSANTPRRSMLFVFTTGEEEGLLGARWFAAHPTFPVGRFSADINLDVINVWGRTKDVTVLGLGKSSLDDIVRAVAQAQHRTIHGDNSPDKGQFYRSDHFALASVGVPVAAFVGGPDYQDRPAGWGQTQLDTWISTNYHQVSDEYHADWDLSGAVEDAQLQLIVGLRAANAPELQKWTPGDEFEAARELAPR